MGFMDFPDFSMYSKVSGDKIVSDPQAKTEIQASFRMLPLPNCEGRLVTDLYISILVGG